MAAVAVPAVIRGIQIGPVRGSPVADDHAQQLTKGLKHRGFKTSAQASVPDFGG
jgi:hypothetical protein